jgi:hypothetical protein
MLLRSQSIWDTLPYEIKHIILEQLFRVGAGTIRQVNREWRDMTDALLCGGRKATYPPWITQSIPAIEWAGADGCPIREWTPLFMKQSPILILLHLKNTDQIDAIMVHLAEAGRYEDMCFLHDTHNIKFCPDSMVAAGVCGHVKIVEWMMNVLHANQYYYYFEHTHELKQAMIQSVRETDNCILLEEAVYHCIPISRYARLITSTYARTKTIKWMEDNSRRIDWMI